MRISDWSSDVCSSDLLVQLLEHVGGLVGGTALEADGLGHLLGLAGFQAGERIDVFGDDFLGRRVGDFLDVHAAFAGGDVATFRVGGSGNSGTVCSFWMLIGKKAGRERVGTYGVIAGVARHYKKTTICRSM